MGRYSGTTSGKQIVLDLVLFAAAQVTCYYLCKLALSSLDQTSHRKKAGKLPDFVEARLARGNHTLNEYELVVASEILNPIDLKVSWKDIGGLDDIIDELQELVVLPFTRPDIFSSKSQLLKPPRGLLLYGRPGCGKTLLAKAIAKESDCTFINLNIATLTDKWYGETPKLVAALFTLAEKVQPTIVFIDEIDSLLRERSNQDHEATAMMKTQFMSMWDGMATDPNCHVMIIGATNRPHDVDKAILRRMPRKFHVGMPDNAQREAILRVLLANENIDEELDYWALSELTANYSGSDLKELCRVAAMFPVRELIREERKSGNTGEHPMRPMCFDDFENAIEQIGGDRRHYGDPMLSSQFS